MNPVARLLRTGRASRLSAGPGSSVFETPLGRIVRFGSQGADFSHPWLAVLSGSAALFLPGSVNQVQATIKGVPLDGSSKPPVAAPSLTWGKLSLTADGIGYLCAEITLRTPAEALKVSQEAWSVVKVEMVQVADPDTDLGQSGGVLNTSGAARPLTIKGEHRARWPVAMIQQRADGAVELFQIVYFNLTHRAALRADGKGVARHFFY
ncbi:MAG: hypothetical protein QOE70_4044 [Chthoniobacter sp.]|jgi:hypothetical protein|nr:hypothetical protein [Chthoniobacter sp.]